MATLSDDVKVFIVQALACYDSPCTVATAVKEQFGVVISRQQVESYDHTKASSKGVAKKLVALFDETRARFLEGVAAVPVDCRGLQARGAAPCAAGAAATVKGRTLEGAEAA